ncbi:uncharacterized protein ACMZJ9_004851 [Mantella aurantiaca]
MDGHLYTECDYKNIKRRTSNTNSFNAYQNSTNNYGVLQDILDCWKGMPSSRQTSILEQKAQAHLCSAIFNERSKQWEKTVEHYEMLLRILNRRPFSEHADMKPHHKQLIYETYYHLGIAFQNINQHENAVLQYTKALQASSIQKKICTVGCSVRTFLHTPVLTRRAFALVRCGDTKKALQDAETAVVLDSLNPDVYCIRALVWCTMQKEEEAIKDLNYSLHLNPSHVCSLILRGNIQKCITPEKNAFITMNDDQKKALQLNYSSLRFSHVKDFNSLHISEFYNSFLWSLNVPHTVISLQCICPSVQEASIRLKRTSSAPVNNSRWRMIFKGGYPGTGARMYNKPWKGDKLPINEEARKKRQQKNTFSSMQ